MVTEITAFQAEDGTIHQSKLTALEHDTVEKLKKLDTFNHASALAVVQNCVEISNILEPLAKEALFVARQNATEEGH